MDVLGLRAGGNTSTFNADAHCPTCRTPVPYRECKLDFRTGSTFQIFIPGNVQ